MRTVVNFAALMRSIITSLRRVTNSGQFIPEIDGLRFVAIAMVILYHLDGYLFKELQAFYPEDALNFSWWHRILQQGYFGVEVFFVISAFVVSLPFARWKLNGEKPVALGDYFFRRLTRIEPPYLLSLLLLLWLQLLMSYGVRWSDFIPDFYYSLFYSHGFLYHRDFQPLVNNVTWSLEIEVQFYVLAPLLFYFVFRKSKNALGYLLLLTLAFSLLTKLPKPSIISLYEYFHFFLLGISLAWMKARQLRWPILDQINEWMSTGVVSTIAFVLMAWTDITYMGPLHTWFKLMWSSLQILFVFILFYNTLITPPGKSWIVHPWVTAIGGMCYSLYLFHNQMIMRFGYYLVRLWRPGHFILDYIYFSVILLLLILIVSAAFYLLIERPCMDKRWPQKLWKWFSGIVDNGNSSSQWNKTEKIS